MTIDSDMGSESAVRLMGVGLTNFLALADWERVKKCQYLSGNLLETTVR